MTWAGWVVTLIGGLGGLTGAAALLNAWFSRGKNKADAAQVLTGSALTLVHEMEDDARAAREELKQSREELKTFRREASTELQIVREEARALADELHRLRMAIMAPHATVESLRLLVTGPGQSNGHLGP
jgi:hypothetical protein